MNKTLFLLSVCLSIFASEVQIQYLPGYSPIKEFTIVIKSKSIEITMGTEKETIITVDAQLDVFDKIMTMKGHYAPDLLPTDCATYLLTYKNDGEKNTVSVYAMDLVSENDRVIATIHNACDYNFKLVSRLSQNAIIKKNLKYWAQ